MVTNYKGGYKAARTTQLKAVCEGVSKMQLLPPIQVWQISYTPNEFLARIAVHERQQAATAQDKREN